MAPRWPVVPILWVLVRYPDGRRENRLCTRVDGNAGQFETQGHAGYQVIWGYQAFCFRLPSN